LRKKISTEANKQQLSEIKALRKRVDERFPQDKINRPLHAKHMPYRFFCVSDKRPPISKRRKDQIVSSTILINLIVYACHKQGSNPPKKEKDNQ